MIFPVPISPYFPLLLFSLLPFVYSRDFRLLCSYIACFVFIALGAFLVWHPDMPREPGFQRQICIAATTTFDIMNTSVNLKSPEIMFFLKFWRSHDPTRIHVTNDGDCLEKSLAGDAAGRLTQIVMHGDLLAWRKLQLIVNHLESGPFRRSDFLRRHASYPHVYRIRWVWFVFSLACAADDRPSKRDITCNQILSYALKTSTHSSDPLFCDLLWHANL